MTDKYAPGEVVKVDVEPTNEELLDEVLDFEADLKTLMLDLRERRNSINSSAERSRLRAVGSRLEDALRELRAASRIVRGEAPEHDGRGPG